MTAPAEAPKPLAILKDAAPVSRPRELLDHLSTLFSDFGLRTLSALVLIVVALGSLRIGRDGFVAIWLAAALAIHWEWQKLIGAPHLYLRLGVGFFALVLSAVFAAQDADELAVLSLILAGGAAGYLAGEGRRLWATAGTAYAGLLLLAVIGLRFSFPYGVRSIIWLFATVWGTDVGAYLAGRLIGGPKLWTKLSPSKTWSGTVIGVFAGALLGLAFAARGLPGPLAPVFILGLVTAALSQAGDLFESWVKRRFGVKDSSRLIPGHGGVMDRLDGFLVATVFVFVFGLLRGLPSAAAGIFYWT